MRHTYLDFVRNVLLDGDWVGLLNGDGVGLGHWDGVWLVYGYLDFIGYVLDDLRRIKTRISRRIVTGPADCTREQSET